MIDDRLAQLESIPRQVKDAILAAEGTAELIDTLGVINSVQSRIGKEKLAAASEVEPEDAGSRWRYERPMRGVRSYNNSGMFATLMSQLEYETLTGVIRFLMDADILRIQWQWTNLEKLVKRRQLDIRTAKWEVKEGDPDYDMGEYWVNGSAGYKRVEDDG